MFAVELYRVMRQIEELDKKLGSLPLIAPEREEIGCRLREACALRDRLKKMIEGAKD